MEEVNRAGILANWSMSQEELSKYYKSYVELLDEFDADQDLRMEEVLRHAQLETLQMFTPEGALLTFPHESTVLDFAVAVHTDLGLRCSGATVTGLVFWISMAVTGGPSPRSSRFPVSTWPMRDWSSMRMDGSRTSRP